LEVKINKEIRNYTESMLFRTVTQAVQFFLSLPAAWRLAYSFCFARTFGTETLSWVCILGAFPFAAMGFIKYNGMTAEQFVWAWIKSEFLMPKKIVFLPDNLYYKALKPTIEAHEKGLPAVPKKQRAKAQKKPKKAKKRKEVDDVKNA